MVSEQWMERRRPFRAKGEGVKEEVYLTLHEAADALGVSYTTARKLIKDPRVFPGAQRPRYGATKLGYRIPASDVLARAEEVGEDIVAQAEAIIQQAREAQLQRRQALLARHARQPQGRRGDAGGRKIDDT
jgi:hypothetical protein